MATFAAIIAAPLLAAAVLFTVTSCKGDEPAPSNEEPGEETPYATSTIQDGRIAQPETIINSVQSYTAPDPPFPYDVVFEYDGTDFCNPERGPYAPNDFTYDGENVYSLSTEQLEKSRNSGITLHYFGFYLCDFVNSDISDYALSHMRELFENLRKSGTKAIIRYAYSYNTARYPVTDPPVGRILSHISQLKPLWEEYEDVIYLLQCGFTGIFGEWHTTTNINTEEERAQIVKAELDALPVSRQVAIRTVSHKRQILKILDAGTGKLRDTITVNNWNDGSYASRIGYHNDCVFCNSGDGGSYTSQDQWDYVYAESEYVSNGGESSYASITDAAPYCKCDNAYPRLKGAHFSYLSNNNYFRQGWDSIGCGDDAAARVGYRLVLNGAAFRGDFRPGEEFSIKICISNYGYASIINERKLEWVIYNADNPSEKYTIVSKKDPREWRGGKSYVHEDRFTLPDGLRKGGAYILCMNLPDIAPTLHDDPRQSIRLAIKNSWDETTGYNAIATFTAL